MATFTTYGSLLRLKWLGMLRAGLVSLVFLGSGAFLDGLTAPAVPPGLAGPAHGRLEVSTFYLEAPDELLRLGTMPDQRPVWRLPGTDPQAALSALAAAGLDARSVSTLASAGVVSIDADKITILPPLELLLSLSSSARQGVYTLLAGNGLNPHHERPQIMAGDLDEWMRTSALSLRQKEVLKALIWRPNGAQAFSDVSALMAVGESAAEAEEARRVMTRVRTLRVRVLPPAGEAKARFVDYWTAGGSNRSAAPLVSSALDEAPGVGIDLALLLPPLARERIYTYPSFEDAIGGRMPDCNWTSLNFFAARPQPYYLDSKTSYTALMQEYEAVARAERFGDLIAFVSAGGLVLHTCLLVAEDIVFTKNGQSAFAPWLLQRLADVSAIYGGADRSVRVFRLRAPPSIESAPR